MHYLKSLLLTFLATFNIFLSVEDGLCGGCNKMIRGENEKDSLLKSAVFPVASSEDFLKIRDSVHLKFGEMVEIKRGNFTLGSDEPVFVADKEGPSYEVFVKNFLIDVHEVSNVDFWTFVNDTGYITQAEHFGNSFVLDVLVSEEVRRSVNQSVAGAPWWILVKDASWKSPEGVDSNISARLDHPVVHVSWIDATEFCKWANKRLPTEVEWEVACRSGLKSRLFSWGNKLKPFGKHHMNIWQGKFPTENTLEDGYLSTAPVNEFEASPYGIKNMLGNVWEWTSDDWAPKNEDHKSSSEKGGTRKVKKGGSFMCHKDWCYRYRCAARSENTLDSSASNLGFRCASDVHHASSKTSPSLKLEL